MDIQQLYTALQPFQNTSGKTLTIPATSITGWTDIHRLLTDTLAGATLSLTSVQTFPAPPTANIIRYQGSATLFPWSGGGTQTVLSVTANFSVDANGNPQLVLSADVPASAGGWTLTESLAGLGPTSLAEVKFQSSFFLLTSTAVTVTDYPLVTTPGINFKGRLKLTGALAMAQPLLVTEDSQTVAGPVNLTAGDMPEVSLGPAGSTPITLAGLKLQFGANLTSEYKELPYYDPNNPGKTTTKRPFASAHLTASLAFGSGAPLAFTLSLLPQSDSYTLATTGASVPLSSWSDLNSLTGGINLGALVPAAVPAAVSLELKQLSMTLYVSDGSGLPTVSNLTFDVAMNVGSWPLLPNDILTVSEVGAFMSIQFIDGLAPQANGELYTHFSIVEEVQMVAALGIPRLDLTASLEPDMTVSMAALMASVMQKLTGKTYTPPIDMEITRLDMSVNIHTGAFGFGTDIFTDWSISLGQANGGALIDLGFDGISFDIDYDGQLLQGSLTAFTHIDQAKFYFTGTSPGNDYGWGFAGGLVRGSSLSITKLLTALMYPNGPIPGRSYGVPDLVVDKLQATLATDKSNNPLRYTFDGSMSLAWDFKIFNDQNSPTFKLTASLSLTGTKGQQQNPRLSRPHQPPGTIQHQPHHSAPQALTYEDITALPVSLDVSQASNEWVISGEVKGTFSLFNLLISAAYQFAPDNSALSFGIWYKQRGIQATVTQKVVKGTTKNTFLTIRLGDLSFGEIIEYLINLALPGEHRTLSAPWDILYQINFKNLELVVNLTTSDVEVDYRLNLDLTFAKFDKIGLLYKSVNGEGKVYVQLYGQFLGQPFGTNDDPLSWDVLNDEAPEVPGKGPKLIDLRYVGMGQHIALSVPASELDTVEKVITALKASMQPVTGGGNPLTDPKAASLRYSGNSTWMFGLDATVLDTLSLSAVFFDPTIYGALIKVSGERGGALNGLRFELLYRKISDDIGELSVDLRVPDMFRHLEFGEVSVTLGIIHVDIFTNGNFRVDLGFPHNQDFSIAFAVEVFPFIGEGGLYFAYLTGATSDRVPLITNGEFDPVIEAGVGLSVGLGKDFQAGPLKAGLKVEVYGIFEGVFAPFNPYDKASDPGFYFWVQGTAGIVGTLYGSVDFVVIKASVSIVARASVTLVLEAHKPSDVELKVEVTAKASVKVLFVTVHFSFSLTIEESFKIGSATATPWIVGTQNERLASHHENRDAIAFVSLGHSDHHTPRLRQQRSQKPRLRLTRLRHARHYLPGLMQHPDHRSLHQIKHMRTSLLMPEMAFNAPSADTWTPVPVFGAGQHKTARVQFLPMFTVADPASLYGHTGASNGNQTEIVLGFIAENAVNPQAHGHVQSGAHSLDHVHHLDASGDPPLASMVEAFFRWAAQAGAGKTGTDPLSLLQLEDLLKETSDPDFQQRTFAYSNLSSFMSDSLHLDIIAYPQGTQPGTIAASSGTFVPVCPEISARLVQGTVTTNIDFASHNPTSTAYATNLAAYFKQLMTNATQSVADAPSVSGSTQSGSGAGAGGTASLAELIFSEYFLLLTQAALQNAVALLQNYPYTYPQTNGPSLKTLAGGFPTLTARARLSRGQTLADLALFTGHHPQTLADMNPLAARGDSLDVNIPVGVTALSIAEDNTGVKLAEDLQIAMPRLAYQVRSGQTLNEVATAIPFVDPAHPLTGLQIGTANKSVQGFLREGTKLKIPAFTYQPVAGDTQHFITAFFKVRNEGVTGAPNLDWYEQAISTLNPNVNWDTLSPSSAPLSIPTAYLNSTPASSTYTVHTGDTLATIAATFARFQAMDNATNPAVTSPVTIPAMDHTITSTDTLDMLAGTTFPGLALNDLITNNLTEDVLTPLHAAWVAPFTAKLPKDQTLQTLSDAYDLAIADLVPILENLTGLFEGNAGLTIRDVPALPVDQFVTALKTTGQLNTVAMQVSNFLAHGLRVPAPDDTTFTGLTPAQVLAGDFTGSLYGIVDLTGQQTGWTDPSTTPVDVTLSHSSADWISFSAATVNTQPNATVAEELLAHNPGLQNLETIRAGQLLATGTLTDITLTIDHATFGNSLPSKTVTLNASAPQVLSNYEDTKVHYNFQVTQHWQAGVRPTLPAAAGNADHAPGEPSLWPLPSNLQQLTDAGGNLPFDLRVTALNAPPDDEGSALKSYAWAIQIPVALHRVTNPGASDNTSGAAAGDSPAQGDWIDGLYLCKGTDASHTDRLYQLWTYLGASATDTGNLFLLYPPNATSSTPKGYASDAVSASKTVLLKTNLSTTTRNPTVGSQAELEADALAVTPETYSAAVSAAGDFLMLLWEASVVVEGGFYLSYDADGAGLPDFVFDENGQGTIQVVCLLHSQSSSNTSGGPLMSFNNVAIVGDNVDAASSQVFGEQTGANAPTTRLATIPPGTGGFSIERTDPSSVTNPTAADLSGMLYGLIGYKLGSGGGFTASNEAIPQGPAPTAGDTHGTGDKVTYSQTISLYPRANPSARTAQSNPWLPAVTDDPYTGVSSTSMASLSFLAHDIFGNKAVISDPLSGVSVPDRYTDRLTGLSDWPGTTWDYTFSGTSPSAKLMIEGALQINSYLPGPDLSSEKALRSASAHAVKFKSAFYQLRQPGMGVAIKTSLSSANLTPPLAPLIGYLSTAYVFTSQIAGLTIKTHKVTSGQSLQVVTNTYSVPAAAFLKDNIDRPISSLFASSITLPRFEQVKHNETLNAFATRVNVSAATLLSQWHNTDVTVIPSGTDLAIPATTGTLSQGKTLSDYAAASKCSLGDLGRANKDVTGLISDGLTLFVGTKSVTSQNATFTSLVSDFANQGVTTTIEEIAVSNKLIVDLFNPAHTPATYAVDRRVTDKDQTISQVVTDLFGGNTATFISLNGDLPGMMTQDSRMQTGSSSETVPAGESLRGYLAQAGGVTLADFTAANLTSTMTTDSLLILPALLDAGALAAVPYGIQSGMTFGGIASKFGVTADALAGQVETIGGLFIPGQTITVSGSGNVTTTAEDSLASLLPRFPTSTPTLAQLVSAIQAQTGLMQEGSQMVCPAPLASQAGSGSALSLTTLATAFLTASQSDAIRLAKANGALDGFLKQGANYTISNHTFTVGPSQTLANSLALVNATLGQAMDYDAFLTALLGQAIVNPSAKVLLPAPALSFGGALPASPAVTSVISQLQTSVILTRPANEIDTNFTQITEVGTSTSPIPPKSKGVPASLTDFATALGTAYGGALWCSTGPTDTALANRGNQRQYAVHFGASGQPSSVKTIRKVKLGENTPAPGYLALPPLATSLISREASIRTYQSGQNPPFSQDASATVFQSIDVMDWVVDFLATLDLLLSPAYASPAYEITKAAAGSDTFNALTTAKGVLATAIAGQLTPIEQSGAAIDAQAARSAIEQQLRANLSQGYQTDAVIQVPATVEADFATTGSDKGGHRLSGQINAPGHSLSTTTTLQSLATEFSISLEGVIELLAATPNILETGQTLNLNNKQWHIAAHDTLAIGMTTLAATAAQFATAFKDTKPLFRDGTSLTVDGYTAKTVFGSTLTSMANALDVSLRYLALANMDVDGLLTGTVYLRGTSVTITPATSSLSGLAASQSLTVEVLSGLIAEQAVLAVDVTLHTARWVPEYSLTAGKIDLASSSKALTTLLSTRNRAHYRRLFLNLSFDITALEYAVEPAQYVDGYETSKWLTFVNPLPSTPSQIGGADIDTSIGQLDIPIPLRAYPITPRLANQRAQATYKPLDIKPSDSLNERIRKAKAWSYYAAMEMQLAAQDTARITIGINFTEAPHADMLAVVKDPFDALAEFSTNAAAIKTDLTTLLTSPGDGSTTTPAKSAVLAMADLATKVSTNWGFVQNGTFSGGNGDNLVPESSYTFRMQKRTKSGANGELLLDALVLIREAGTASWGPASHVPSLGYYDAKGVLKPLKRETLGTPTPDYIFYSFQEPVPDEGKRIYVIWYDDLDVTTYQNARASLSILRNQNLVPGKETASAFVYQTPALTFSNLSVPGLRWDKSILFGSGSSTQLSSSLTTIFTAILGSPPTSARTEEKLIGRYGYRLAPDSGPLGAEDIVSLVPMFYRPLFSYSSSVVTDTQSAVTDWFSTHTPETGQTAFLSFDMQVFSGLLPSRKQPLIAFTRLDYTLT
ncbi:hypothetical protein [Coralliovum pocilloporae]|uniref:hypothetical protein n=1 Tax=Coralliovum pocilloporae TaxID=3066369 RepID=UPI003306E29B